MIAPKEKETIVLSPYQEDMVKLESSLIGELKDFETLNLLGSLNKLEGWLEVRLSYIGGLYLQLDFVSVTVICMRQITHG